MKKRGSRLRRALCVVLAAATLAAAAPALAAGETASCAECGMTARIEGRFTARVGQGAGAKYFCDIGDLVAFLERTKAKADDAWVHDFASGAWVEAAKALYVRDKRYETPMGWGIAAFADAAAAAAAGAPLTLEKLRATAPKP